jgi:hypothetical protein
MQKKTDSAKALLKESLQNASASIPLDLWGAVAIRAIREARPAQEIMIEALGYYLMKRAPNILVTRQYKTAAQRPKAGAGVPPARRARATLPSAIRPVGAA